MIAQSELECVAPYWVSVWYGYGGVLQLDALQERPQPIDKDLAVTVQVDQNICRSVPCAFHLSPNQANPD